MKIKKLLFFLVIFIIITLIIIYLKNLEKDVNIDKLIEETQFTKIFIKKILNYLFSNPDNVSVLIEYLEKKGYYIQNPYIKDIKDQKLVLLNKIFHYLGEEVFIFGDTFINNKYLQLTIPTIKGFQISTDIFEFFQEIKVDLQNIREAEISASQYYENLKKETIIKIIYISFHDNNLNHDLKEILLNIVEKSDLVNKEKLLFIKLINCEN